MQAAKKEATLDKYVRVNGEVMTQKQMVYSLLTKGYVPTIEYNYSYYSRKLDAMTKPKDQYRLTNTTDNTHYTITKTEYDFANHILTNNFLNESVLVAYVTSEQQTEEAEQLAEEQRIKQEREENARMKQEAESKRNAELQAKQSNWIEQGKQYMTDEVKTVITSLVNDNWNTLSQMTTDTKEAIITSFISKFTMWIGNRKGIEANMYSYADTDRDYTIESHPSLFFEQQFSTLVFGLNKGDHGNTIIAKVKAFYNNTTHPVSTPKETTLEEVYILDTTTKEYTVAKGEKHTIQGITCYLVEMNNKYNMVEARTGMLLLQPCTNKTDAIKLTRERIKANKDKIHNVIDQAINRFGLSPLYANKQAM